MASGKRPRLEDNSTGFPRVNERRQSTDSMGEDDDAEAEEDEAGARETRMLRMAMRWGD